MLNYLAFLVGPMPFIAVIITAIVAACMLGWLLVSRRITATWNQIVERPTSESQHPYRDPLRVVGVQRVPLLLCVAARSNFALYASTAICILVAADEAYCAHFGGSAIALCLFIIGLATAYWSTRLIMRGPGAFAELRGRVTNMAILNLLIHGMVLIAFLALAMGLFDDARFDTHGIKGLTSVMSLGQLRSLAGVWPIWLSVNGNMVGVWQVIGIAEVVHAYVSFAHAVILYALVFQLNGQYTEGRARFRNWLIVKLLVVLGALAGFVFIVRHWVPSWIDTASELEETAIDAYEAMRYNCKLPPLPEEAFDLSGRHDAHQTAKFAHVRFRTSEPLAYEEELARAGWKELLRIDRGPPPFYPIAHLSFTPGSGGNIHLNCRMTVDRHLGIIDFDAAAD